MSTPLDLCKEIITSPVYSNILMEVDEPITSYSGRFIANSAHFQRPSLRNKVGDFVFSFLNFGISNSSANSTREIKKNSTLGRR